MKAKVRKNALEWTVFAMSLVLIAGALAVLLYSGARFRSETPELTVVVGPASATPAGYRSLITVKNSGGRTAEQARVEVVLRKGEEEIERSELTFPFVPRRSLREGYVVFRNDPRCCVVEGHAAAYEQP